MRLLEWKSLFRRNMMNKTDFTAILQVALWRNDGLSELEIRQHLANLCSNDIIQAGIKLCDYLNSIKIRK